MFSRPLSDLTHTVGFRLTLWYSGMFILSMSLLFGFVYFILSASLTKQDHEMIHSRLGELSSVYARGGVADLEREVTGEKKFKKADSFLVRVADPTNTTLFLILPYQWAEFDLKGLEKKPSDDWLELASRTGKEILEVASTGLAFGYTLQVGKSTEDRERILKGFRRIFVAALIPLVLLGFLVGIFLSRRALHPIRQLTETVRSVSSGRMDARAPTLRSRDEIGELILLFNTMVEKIEKLIRGMGESLDNVAHDLRTPMTRLRGIAEMALRTEGDGKVCREALADCLEESDRILEMLNTLMDISEAESGTMNLELRKVRVSDLMDKVMELYGYVAEEKNLQIETTCPRELFFVVDPVRVGQVLGNLVDNAVKYTPPGGVVGARAEVQGNKVLIAVSDTGIGIGPEELPKIWDRLYRSDRSRSQKGLGLGLSLVRAIVVAHKGEVRVTSEPGRGSVFTVCFPLDPSSASGNRAHL